MMKLGTKRPRWSNHGYELRSNWNIILAMLESSACNVLARFAVRSCLQVLQLQCVKFNPLF